MKKRHIRKDCPRLHLQDQGRSSSARRQEKGKDKRCEKKNTFIAIVNIAKSETRQHVVEIYASTRSISKLAQKPSSGRIGVRFSRQSLERATFRESCPSLTITRTHHVVKDQQSEMRSEKSVQDTHSVQSLHRATQNERTLHTCPQNRLLQEVWSHEGNREKHGFTNQRNDVHRRPWCLITHDRILVSNLLRQARVHIKEVGASLSVHLEGCSPSPLLLGRSCNELGYSVCAWPAGGTHRLSIGKKVIDCGIENFVSVEVPDKKWYHPKKFHQPWVTESWREMWSTPYWNC